MRDRLARGISGPAGSRSKDWSIDQLPAPVILSLSLSSHSPADDDAVVKGGHDTVEVVGSEKRSWEMLAGGGVHVGDGS
jgi:hypothetical protein